MGSASLPLFYHSCSGPSLPFYFIANNLKIRSDSSCLKSGCWCRVVTVTSGTYKSNEIGNQTIPYILKPPFSSLPTHFIGNGIEFMSDPALTFSLETKNFPATNVWKKAGRGNLFDFTAAANEYPKICSFRGILPSKTGSMAVEAKPNDDCCEQVGFREEWRGGGKRSKHFFPYSICYLGDSVISFRMMLMMTIVIVSSTYIAPSWSRSRVEWTVEWKGKGRRKARLGKIELLVLLGRSVTHYQ